mmetsp:Transcript_13125/g.16828  ORF Transcript_13125/g.16828 Transcript_13125/m.16828 type:complete len:238 (-) Transcript_13125:64-777(-)
MHTDYWASVDQCTSLLKDPWKFDRLENKKSECILSKQHEYLHSKQWPNTTCDFTWTYKDNTQKNTERSLRYSHSTKSLSSASNQQRSSLPSRQGPSSNPQRSRSQLIKVPSLPLEQSGYLVSSQNTFNGSSSNSIVKRPGSLSRGRHSNSAPLLTPPREVQNHFPKTKSLYSTTHIGKNKQQAKRIQEMHKNNYERYVQAAKDTSNRKDLVFGAETHHFRHKYPHTLGKMKAFSEKK